ncbi:hypothetical protein [Enterovirga rhinocerotis]|uniref:hypothetical protein n=1 Tax=Enterovirga rhinocerotis TaxID=1339210 RepID=UPI00105BF8B5|nr:hypothetical protein [Enterovirga rhinocerotis]
MRHASDLPPPDRVIATASIGLLHPTPGLDKMRTGLEERARAIRAATHPLALPLPEPAPAARMVARSITFDLARGERTIVFENGETITAPFDRTMASDLTGFNAAPR